MTREPLPNRRGLELLDFEHGGLHYTASIGRFPDGRLAEIFLHSAKAGSDAADIGRDAAIVASLALQHGCSADTLRHALTRGSDGRAAGPIGAVLDMLEGGSS
ncbi:MAG: hypothetical protein ACHQAY_27290 [Hyphomicrobiales bacterium]